MTSISDRVLTGTLSCRRAGTEPDRPSRQERRENNGWYQIYDPQTMSDKKLVKSLCSLGMRPGRCAACHGCKFGDEVVRRGGIEQIVLAAQQKRRNRHGE